MKKLLLAFVLLLGLTACGSDDTPANPVGESSSSLSTGWTSQEDPQNGRVFRCLLLNGSLWCYEP